ncbi:hypothetical protein IDG46_30400, partial [Staphylococcus sp. EG-SA-13]|nr:hypothetical protein [Staphylococcus sp. EG-SA-13]
LTIVPPKDVTPGTEVDIPVTVTYPDGSTEELPVKVVVEKSTDQPVGNSLSPVCGTLVSEPGLTGVGPWSLESYPGELSSACDLSV